MLDDEIDISFLVYPFFMPQEDVEKGVPPKEETRVSIELTLTQKRLYRALFEKNVSVLNPRGRKAGSTPSLMNVVMQLRKCCNHPFMLAGVRDDLLAEEAAKHAAVADGGSANVNDSGSSSSSSSASVSSNRDLELLVSCSGKMVFLDKLLPKLKREDHKVIPLVFGFAELLFDGLVFPNWKQWFII